MVYLEESGNPSRKTKYDLVAVEKGDRLINMDAQAPNQVFREWVRAGNWGSGFDSAAAGGRNTAPPALTSTGSLRGRRGFVEVKGVTLEEDGVVRFPDAPTLRGVKHLEELAAARAAGYEAAVCFVIQVQDVRWLEPNDATHPRVWSRPPPGRGGGSGGAGPGLRRDAGLPGPSEAGGGAALELCQRKGGGAGKMAPPLRRSGRRSVRQDK